MFASGGPAGGQTFEKFDKQVLRAISTYLNSSVCRLISPNESTGTFSGLISKSDPPEALLNSYSKKNSMTS